jgi:hypothetical protein
MSRTIFHEPASTKNCLDGMTIIDEQFETTTATLKCAKKLPAEDIAVGDFVALGEIGCQLPSFFWCGADTTMWPPDQPVHITFLPFGDREPLKVKSVCLPFVLCELPNGKPKVHDVRQVQLLKLDHGFAQTVCEEFNKKKKNKKKKRKNRKKKSK